jgi:proteasome accessory factor B
VLGLAARAWQQAALSQAAGTAVLKLSAAGGDPDWNALLGLEPRVGATEPAFADLWAAVRDRHPVSFDYRGPKDPTPARRRVEPWGLLSRGGRWYLVGADRDRGAARVFRVSRVNGPVTRDGADGSVVVPPGTDLREHLERMNPPEPREVARVRVLRDAGVGLRRSAIRVEPLEGGWDALEIPYGDADQLAAELVGYGPAVVVLGPAEVREAAVARLRAMVGES